MIALLVICLGAGPALGAPEDLRDAANAAYVAGDFAQAAQDWGSLIEAGHATGDLYYNLGNALYRDGRSPEAIVAWRRAQQLSPRDGDVLANLDRARRGVVDHLDPAAEPGVFFWRATLSTGEQGWLAALLLGALGVLGVVARLRKDVHAGLPAFLLGVPALLLTLSTGASLRAPLGAVVLADEVEVRSAGGEGSGVVLFSLHAGAEIVLGDGLGAWQLVVLPDGRKGWVPRGAVGVVDASAPIPGPTRREGRSGETG